jgi:hypothetical protein
MIQLTGDTFPVMSDTFLGTATDKKDVQLKAPASMLANLNSVSNEIDESDLQNEKRDELRT